MFASTSKAASACMLGTAWLYTSKVIATDECPARSLAIFGCTFPRNRFVMWVWRSPWKVTPVTSEVVPENRTGG